MWRMLDWIQDDQLICRGCWPDFRVVIVGIRYEFVEFERDLDNRIDQLWQLIIMEFGVAE